MFLLHSSSEQVFGETRPYVRWFVLYWNRILAQEPKPSKYGWQNAILGVLSWRRKIPRWIHSDCRFSRSATDYICTYVLCVSCIYVPTYIHNVYYTRSFNDLIIQLIFFRQTMSSILRSKVWDNLIHIIVAHATTSTKTPLQKYLRKYV